MRARSITAAVAMCLAAAGASAQTYTVLHNFAGGPADGAESFGGLITDGAKFYGTTNRGGANDRGTLYSMNMDGTGFTILRSFGPAPDGIGPSLPPVLDGGVLYGTTVDGGAAGKGTLYTIRTDGTDYAVLRSFTGVPDGESPQGPLVLSGGVLYGITESGGLTNHGTAYSFRTDGTAYAVIHNFAGSPLDGEKPRGTLFLENGTLYGAASEGGTYLAEAGTLFSMATGGSAYTTLHNFSFSDGADPAGAFVSDGTQLYGMSMVGGTATSGILAYYGGGTIFASDGNGSNFRVLHDFDLTNGGAPQSGLVRVEDRLYGTTFSGGGAAIPGPGTIFTINTDGTGYTVLRTFDGLVLGAGSRPTGFPLVVNGTFYCNTPVGGTQGKGVVFSYVIPTPPLRVTLSTIFPAAGSPWTIDVAVQPLAQRFDAWAVIQGPDGTYHS
ncbi:MAG: choice-of-anchor tandem repeat GloVer-containing protein, partial [Chlamydiota bacterium]